MAKFMLDDDFRNQQASGNQAIGVGGDERGIFHAAGLKASMRRIHHGDAVIGIRAVPFVEHLQRAFQRLQVAAGSEDACPGDISRRIFTGLAAALPGVLVVRRKLDEAVQEKSWMSAAVKAQRFGAVGVLIFQGEIAARAHQIILGTVTRTSQVPKSAKNSVLS